MIISHILSIKWAGQFGSWNRVIVGSQNLLTTRRSFRSSSCSEASESGAEVQAAEEGEEQEEKSQNGHENQWQVRWSRLAELSGPSVEARAGHVGRLCVMDAVSMAVAQTAELGGADAAWERRVSVFVAFLTLTRVAVLQVDAVGRRRAVVKSQCALIDVELSEANGIAQSGSRELFRFAEIHEAGFAVAASLFFDINAGGVEGTVVDVLAVVDGADGAWESVPDG